MKYLIIFMIIFMISPAYSGINSVNASTVNGKYGVSYSRFLTNDVATEYSHLIKFKINTMPTSSHNASILQFQLQGGSKTYTTAHYIDASDMKVKTKTYWFDGVAGYFAGSFDSGITVTTDTDITAYICVRVETDIMYIDYDINGSTHTDSADTSSYTIVDCKASNVTSEYILINPTSTSSVFGATYGCDMDIYILARVFRIMTAREIEVILSRPSGSTLFAKGDIIDDIVINTFLEHPANTLYDNEENFSVSTRTPVILSADGPSGMSSSINLAASCSLKYISNINTYKKTRRK